MGGYGSGRFSHSGRRPTTSQRFALDAPFLHRHGVLREGGRFSMTVEYANGPVADIDAFYTRGGVRMAPAYHSRDKRPHLRLDDLLVEWTDCHYGGSRPWFICPRSGCGRRAAIRLRAHYLDMAAHLTGNPFQAEQLRFATDFQNLRRPAVITAGVAPGLRTSSSPPMRTCSTASRRFRFGCMKRRRATVPSRNGRLKSLR